MTNETPDPAPTASAPPESAQAVPLTANKAFWAGIGVGSAALVAALMYATRSRRKK